jgi:hypothetical protein
MSQTGLGFPARGLLYVTRVERENHQDMHRKNRNRIKSYTRGFEGSVPCVSLLETPAKGKRLLQSSTNPALLTFGNPKPSPSYGGM